jgi:hypothetical protein
MTQREKKDMTSDCTFGHKVRMGGRYPVIQFAVYHSCYHRGVSYSKESYKGSASH